jgi:hypothetical protein
MITLKKELDEIQGYIWQIRALIGRGQYKAASDILIVPSTACDTVAHVSNHLPLEELKILKELSEQCIDLIGYLNEKQDSDS